MGADPVPGLPGEVGRFQHPVDAEALLGMKPGAVHIRTQGGLPDVAEGRVPDVMGQTDRLGQVFVESQRSGDRSPDLGDVEGVGEPGDVVVVVGVDEHLGLVLEAAERIGVDDAVAVAFETGPVGVGGFFDQPSAAGRGSGGGRAEENVLFRLPVEARAGRQQKELPQPQVRVTLGLEMAKPAPCNPSR